MIRTLEEARVAFVGLAHLGAAVATVVGEDVDPALPVARDDDRVDSDPALHEITGIRDLALVRYEDPRPGEDLFDLGPEHDVVVEDLDRD